MTSDQVRTLIFRLSEGFPAPPLVPLDDAPEPEFDLGIATICPQCGGTYCHTEVAEGVAQVRCHTCGCEFCQPRESAARRMICSIMERERRRKHFLEIPTVRHKGHKGQHGQQTHNTDMTGVGVARKMVNDRITTG